MVDSLTVSNTPKKRWQIAEKVSTDLSEQLLSNRGITEVAQIEKFFQSRLTQLSKIGKLFPDLEKAVVRVSKAIKEKEIIFIYGDYDVDGITGCAILWETIDYLGGKVMPYIPSRHSEGYGLNTQAIEFLAKDGAKVIISVDCGITAVEQGKAAKNLGVDLIITDHHQIQDSLPEPFALLHTTTLSGSGVASRFAEALLESFGREDSEQFYKNLELAALGTIADMVPLTSDNRILVKNGLPLLSKTNRLGLQSLYEEAGLGKVIGTYEVGFMISPRLNSMGRLGSAMDSLRLLLTRDRNRAQTIAKTLSEINKARQEQTVNSFLHAKNEIEKNYLGKKFLVVDSQLYPEGVVGLVASRLIEKFYRPIAVIGKGEKVFKGSARSIPGFNITEAIHTQEKILVSHGGHPMAAGFSIEETNIQTFRENLEKLAEEQLDQDKLTPVLKIDTEIELTRINEDLGALLKNFEPFGIGNPEPIFLTRNLHVVQSKVVGKDNSHLKLNLSDHGGRVLEGVGFGLGVQKPREGSVINLVYSIRENTWNNEKKLEARIKDFQLVTSH